MKEKENSTNGQNAIMKSHLERRWVIRVACAIGFLLPIIAVIGGTAWILVSLAEDARNKRDIQRMFEENSRIIKEYFNNKYGEGTIK